MLPILERISYRRKRLYSIDDIICLLLHPKLQSSKFACSMVPTSINENVSFIVDLDCLEDPRDVLADDMGGWRNNGVHMTYFSVTLSPHKVDEVNRCHSPHTASHILKRVYRTHTTNKTFKKMTAHICGKI